MRPVDFLASPCIRSSSSSEALYSEEKTVRLRLSSVFL